jgi:hypothetical protein
MPPPSSASSSKVDRDGALRGSGNKMGSGTKWGQDCKLAKLMKWGVADTIKIATLQDPHWFDSFNGDYSLFIQRESNKAAANIATPVTLMPVRLVMS